MGKSMIAVVDDDELVRSATVSLLRSMDYECCAFASASDFLNDVECHYQCVVSDIQMPDISGIELAHLLSAREEPPPVILITAYLDSSALRIKASGLVSDLLEKPLDADNFLAAVELALAGH